MYWKVKKLTRGVSHRRRRERRTDYNQRLKLLKGDRDRIVVRNQLSRTVCQVVRWKAKGDKTLVNADSGDLREYGWRGHGGNLPATYLTGYLLGKRALVRDIKECVLDIGLQKNTKGNRIYAAVKGARDTGLEVPVGASLLPSDDRVKGKHIENYASRMKEGEKKDHFSRYAENGLDPENISENFDEVKQKIEGE